MRGRPPGSQDSKPRRRRIDPRGRERRLSILRTLAAQPAASTQELFRAIGFSRNSHSQLYAHLDTLCVQGLLDQDYRLTPAGRALL